MDQFFSGRRLRCCLLFTLSWLSGGGLATLSRLTLDRAGTFAFLADDGNLPSATTDPFAINNAGSQLVFAVEPASAGADGKLPTITINTDDISGNLVSRPFHISRNNARTWLGVRYFHL